MEIPLKNMTATEVRLRVEQHHHAVAKAIDNIMVPFWLAWAEMIKKALTDGNR
jgi:hypothetical protein